MNRNTNSNKFTLSAGDNIALLDTHFVIYFLWFVLVVCLERIFHMKSASSANLYSRLACTVLLLGDIESIQQISMYSVALRQYHVISFFAQQIST